MPLTSGPLFCSIAFCLTVRNGFLLSALQEHWFAIRQVGGEWWNFNSLYPAPEHLSAFYLTAYLDSLKQQGYTIFVVRGQLPASPAASGAELDGPGKWWSPDEVGWDGILL
jgi:hypothetical protein